MRNPLRGRYWPTLQAEFEMHAEDARAVTFIPELTADHRAYLARLREFAPVDFPGAATNGAVLSKLIIAHSALPPLAIVSVLLEVVNLAVNIERKCEEDNLPLRDLGWPALIDAIAVAAVQLGDKAQQG